ncbi:Uncharacterised protein [Klebsiella michiganensis]|nr:Uncharacterised protein [Klebsiella michiganensis]
MDDPLRNALVVKMGDFFAQDKIFQQRGAAFARAQRVLVVCDAYALIGGKRKILAAFTLFFKGIELFAVRIRGFHTARGGRLLHLERWDAAWAASSGLRGLRHPDLVLLPGRREPVIDGVAGYGVYQTLLAPAFIAENGRC